MVAKQLESLIVLMHFNTCHRPSHPELSALRHHKCAQRRPERGPRHRRSSSAPSRSASWGEAGPPWPRADHRQPGYKAWWTWVCAGSCLWRWHTPPRRSPTVWQCSSTEPGRTGASRSLVGRGSPPTRTQLAVWEELLLLCSPSTAVLKKTPTECFSCTKN